MEFIGIGLIATVGIFYILLIKSHEKETLRYMKRVNELESKVLDKTNEIGNYQYDRENMVREIEELRKDINYLRKEVIPNLRTKNEELITYNTFLMNNLERYDNMMTFVDEPKGGFKKNYNKRRKNFNPDFEEVD